MSERLDRALVARGLYPTRARAADAVRRGAVRVNGAVAKKPGQMVDESAVLSVDDAARDYVSRAALKLLAALDAEPELRAAIEGAVCVDIGASTGGFTQVLLQHGAARVYAVDVGHGQLHAEVVADARVINLEGMNARSLSAAQVPEEPRMIVSDVSFISLKKALPAALALAAEGAWLAALVKPQFEAGPQHVGAGGIVRSKRVREAVVADIRAWLTARGWKVRRTLPSPIAGADGNVEFLLVARKAG